MPMDSIPEGNYTGRQLKSESPVRFKDSKER